MDRIIEKSGFNTDAAELLIVKGWHASSVHCSYYACLQFLKFTLKNYLKQSYEYIEAECLNSTLGTHGYIINSILTEFRRKADQRTHKEVKRLIGDLKQFRTDSDYFNIEITINESEKSLKISKQIITEIKSKLK